MEIYERIRELRKNDLHLSQEEFGKKLGVSRGVIKNIELNVLAQPEQKEPLYKLICKEFNLSEDWLKYGKEPKYLTDENEDEYTRAMIEIRVNDEKAKQAILDYWKLNEEDKKLFWTFFDRFIKK